MSDSKQPPGGAAPNNRVLRITVKTLKRKEWFEVAESTVVQDLKQLIAERFQAPPEQLSLIFAGEILNDQDTLAKHKVADGSKVHLFIKSPRNPPPRVAGPGPLLPLQVAGGLPLDLAEWNGQPEELVSSCHELVAQTLENLLLHMISLKLDAPALNSNPFLLGFLVGVTGMSVLGLSATDVSDLVSEGPEQEVTRQELISEVMQHPLVQNLFGDTEQVRQLILSVPQMQQLAEQNPEISHILNNSEFLREMIDVATSPAVMEEIIRNHDRALSNLESIPGGYNALQQLYNDIEAPVLNAVQAQFQGDPFGPSETKPPPPPGGIRPLAQVENREPLPNPWAPQSNSSGDGLSNAAEGNDPASGPGQPGYILLALGPGVRPAPSKSESIQSMIHQLTDNLEFMQSLTSALAKPEGPACTFLGQQTLPTGHGAPLPDGWGQQLPPPLAKSEARALLSNPRAIQALLQMQTSLLTLTREVPDFLQGLSDPDVEPESMEDSDEGDSLSTETASLLSARESLELGSHEEDATTEEDEEEREEEDDDEEEEAMEQQSPAVLYQAQLEELQAMGHLDEERNLQALIDAEGDIGAALEKLTHSRET